jgi:hypothetical protein
VEIHASVDFIILNSLISTGNKNQFNAEGRLKWFAAFGVKEKRVLAAAFAGGTFSLLGFLGASDVS